MPPAKDKLAAGEPIGDKAPKLEDLQGQLCPNCHTGVLYVTRYDPEASYEQGDNVRILPERHRSGGGYEVNCLACTFSESRAFNPGPDHGTERN